MKKGFLILLLINSFLFCFSQTEAKKIYLFEIDGNISKPALRKVEKAIKESKKFDILAFKLNTFGGELETADKIRTLLLNCEIPVYVFIDNNAASAGALISIAADSIFMAPGSSIGAASVVNQNGDILPDKYQSYMRSLMRTTAEQNGRNPLIAQAMVDPCTYIYNVSDSGKVLTFTTREAIINNYCEGEVSSVEEMLNHAGVTDYTIEKQHLSLIDKIIGFLVNPIVSGILIMMIVGGIYFELQTPGIGFPLATAILGAILYFAPHYLEGLAAHWEILLFVIGVILLIIEIFVTPGFGVAGIIGIVTIVGALVLTMVFNIGFNFSFVPHNSLLYKSLAVISLIIITILISFFISEKIIISQNRFGSIALHTTLDKNDGFISQNSKLSELVGKYGIVHTVLRPSGKVLIDNKIYDAVTSGNIIEKNSNIVVINFENSQLIVDKT